MTDLEAAVQAAIVAGNWTLAGRIVSDEFQTVVENVLVAAITRDPATDARISDALRATLIAGLHALTIQMADSVSYAGCLSCLDRHRKDPRFVPPDAVRLPWGVTYACAPCRDEHRAVQGAPYTRDEHTKSCWLCTAAAFKAASWAANVPVR